jgi:hypothetical protein
MINNFLRNFYLVALAYFLMFLVLAGCSNSKMLSVKKSSQQSDCETIHIDSVLVPKHEKRQFNIETMKLNDNCLSLNISYSGGCANPDIQVVLLEVDHGSFPKQTLLDLVITPPDACREIITDSISVDLSYFNAMARDGGIVIRFFEQEKEIFYALPLR